MNDGYEVRIRYRGQLTSVLPRNDAKVDFTDEESEALFLYMRNHPERFDGDRFIEVEDDET